jgi:hypothetical protein
MRHHGAWNLTRGRLVGLLVAAVLVGAGGSYAYVSEMQSADKAAISSTVSAYVLLWVTAEVPPPWVQGDAHISHALANQWKADITARIHALATGFEAGYEVSIASSYIDDVERGGDTMLGGGIDSLQVAWITLDADTASADVTTTVWRDAGHVRSDGVRVPAPLGETLNLHFSLSRVSDKWLISRMKWHFAPGSGV